MRSIVLCLVLASAVSAEEKPILVLNAEGHTAAIKKVMFTPDGKEIITVSHDKTVRIWDVETGESIRVIRPPIGKGDQGRLYTAAISDDGKTLAVAGYTWSGGDHRVYLISLARGVLEQTLQGHRNVIDTVAFSPDGSRVISGCKDLTVRIWNRKSGKTEHVLRGHTGDIYGATFSPDGRKAVTVSDDKTARIWDVKAGKELATLRGHRKDVYCVAWSPDGRTIATGADDFSIRLWNSDGTLRKAFDELGSDITSLQFTRNSRELLVTRGCIGRGRFCSLIHVETGKERIRFSRHDNTVFSGCLSRDGQRVVSVGGDNNDVYVWSTKDGKVIQHLKGKGRATFSAAWSRNGTTLAWGNQNKVPDGTVAFDPIEHTFHLNELDWGGKPDSTFRQARSSLGSLKLVKSGRTTVSVKYAGREQATIRLDNIYDRVRCFTLLPENRAVIGADFDVELFDTRTGKHIRDLLGHKGVVWAVSPSPDNRFLLTASKDQTLRIWDVNRSDPLLSLFFADREWIAWTPEGYYACSAGGEKLMGWHVNQGKDKLAKFYPASQFRKKLFRPDVIKLILRTGNLERAIAIADKKRGEKTRGGGVGELLPPAVKITSPRDGQVEGGKLTVTARAKSRGRHPIVAFKLLVDGQQLPGRRGIYYVTNPKLGDATASWTIQLKPGRHRLQVLAESKVSQGASDDVTIVYKGEKTRLRKPRLILLSIGVSKYQHKSVDRLNYAATDAKKLVDTFLEHSKPLFREIKTKLLMDAEATKDNILDGLDWMIEETTDEDYVILYFAGHGELDNRGNLYFLPVKADKGKLRRSAVRASQLLSALKDLPRSRRILMLDACHAGAVDKGKRRSGDSLTDNLARDLLLPGYGTVVMCSSTGKEFSLENNRYRMGNFTLAITEGLSGKGGKDKAGTVLTHHLHAYVVDRVKELSKGQQHPLMKNPDGIRSFPLSRPK